MEKHNQQLGQQGENLAQSFLQDNGYLILECNYSNRYGEIDIIAKDMETICFVEVKTRLTCEQGHPFEAITPMKINNLTKAALTYLQENDWLEKPARFDVIAILQDVIPSKIELMKNAFDIASYY